MKEVGLKRYYAMNIPDESTFGHNGGKYKMGL
jgi:hypothetical protein